MDDVFAAGDRFLLSQARLLERRLFATLFLGQPGGHVIDALRGYQNDDGGFGHALEPDKRCPASLPIDVEIAFQAMAAAGAADETMIARACDFLAATAANADAGGAVPPALPGDRAVPAGGALDRLDLRACPQPDGRAGRAALPAGHRPSVASAGHRVLLAAACGRRTAWRRAHAVRGADLPRARARPGAGRPSRPVRIAAHFADVSMLHLDPDAEGYGLTPLQLAPEPGSRWRPLFTDAQIDGHLDRLLKEPAGRRRLADQLGTAQPGSLLEWRGVVTLQALRTLTAYGRIRGARLSLAYGGRLRDARRRRIVRRLRVAACREATGACAVPSGCGERRQRLPDARAAGRAHRQRAGAARLAGQAAGHRRRDRASAGRWTWASRSSLAASARGSPRHAPPAASGWCSRSGGCIRRRCGEADGLALLGWERGRPPACRRTPR